MPHIIGIDTGGTFTDCVVMDAEGRIVTAKAASTPDDFSEGVMESLRLAGERLGVTTEALLRDTARLALDVFVCCSADRIPRWGEYERTVATVLNACLGPVMSRYLGRLESRAQSGGLRSPLQVMQCGGGVIPADESARRAFLTLDSGPVAGVLASQYLGSIIGHKHIIATDMGGTSFDVGLVWDGEPVASYQSVVHQYEYFLPRIDIRSIGSGGGSIRGGERVRNAL